MGDNRNNRKLMDKNSVTEDFSATASDGKIYKMKFYNMIPDRIIPIYANDYVNNYDRTLEAGLKKVKNTSLVRSPEM